MLEDDRVTDEEEIIVRRSDSSGWDRDLGFEGDRVI